ncbi:MAG: GWxTD domain-containing protein, partial [Bacteroidales bacterium]|nr:GWxTD domain-containing protein [Bacteroidales bacterium]
FYSLADGPYIETYLQFDASSLHFFATTDGSFRASVDVLMIMKNKDDIIDFRKYELNIPLVDESAKNQFSFIDQQRFAAQADTLDLEITIFNSSYPDEAIRHTESIVVQFDKSAIQLSSIQLVEKFERTNQPGPLTKSGFNITPYVDNFYPSSINQITFYVEIYNAEKVLGRDEGYLVQSFIEVFETGRTVSALTRFKREQAKPVSVLFNEFDISQLPSGNYNLVILLKDKNNEMIGSTRAFFQRSNPQMRLTESEFANIMIANSFVEDITNFDSLTYYVKALGPISTQSQRELAFALVAKKNKAILQQYFLHFWLEHNPLQPREAWRQYHIELCKTDAAFKTPVKRGYESDRGRVYLQYGPPNSMVPSYNEPSAIPYEIWHYYSINGQRNKRFVFATRDIVTNEFDLIHSEVVGEIQNPRWQSVLYNTVLWDVDPEVIEGGWGSRSWDYLKNPP